MRIDALTRSTADEENRLPYAENDRQDQEKKMKEICRKIVSAVYKIGLW